MKELHHTGTTRRYHTVPGLEQDVAAHSWGVAVIIAKLHPAPSIELLKAALFHDCAEKYTGDLPATSKWAHPNLKMQMDAVEMRWAQELGIEIVLPVLEQEWLKAADMLELVLFCDHAVNLGNRYAADIMQNGIRFLNSMPRLPSEISAFLNEQYNT